MVSGKALVFIVRLKSGRVASIKIPGIQYPFSLRKGSSDIAIFEQVFLQGDYDIEFSFTPDVIIDAGANVGLFSIVMKSKFPAAKIICIEPDKDNCGLLRKNLAEYGNTEIVCAGLWNSDNKIKCSR